MSRRSICNDKSQLLRTAISSFPFISCKRWGMKRCQLHFRNNLVPLRFIYLLSGSHGDAHRVYETISWNSDKREANTTTKPRKKLLTFDKDQLDFSVTFWGESLDMNVGRSVGRAGAREEGGERNEKWENGIILIGLDHRMISRPCVQMRRMSEQKMSPKAKM